MYKSVLLKLWGFLLVMLCLTPEIFAQCDNLKPMYGDDCVKSAKMKKADQQFRKTAIAQNGSADSAARVYIRLGWQHFYNQQPEMAMKRFNQAWLLNPEDPQVYFAFGHLTRYAFNTNAAEADKYYRLGRNRDPRHTQEPMSLVRLLEVLDRGNKLEAAIDASAQLIQSYPAYGNGFGYKKRTYYYIQAQRLENALADADKALEYDAKDPNNYVARGYAYAWKGESEKALADYNRAIALDAEFAPAFASRAQLYAEKLNQPEAALADLDKALQLEPNDAALYKMKSEILRKQGRTQDACAVLRNAIAAGVKSLQAEAKATCGK